jgi:hypothetical protein
MRRRDLILSAASWLAAVPPLLVAATAEDYDDPDAVYGALRKQPLVSLSIHGGTIDVVFADDATGIDRMLVLAWIRRCAEAVSTYFGQFPVAHVGLLVITGDGQKIGAGTTFGFAGSAIRIHVGKNVDEDTFNRDWILVHEMTHLALPNVPRQNLWLQEGNATYVEPIARAQAGQLDPAEVWRWSIEGMPKGRPMPGDRGLDYTPTWGRTYWGGATFWLLADVEIYERTGGRHDLRDALRAINRRSGGNGAHWTAQQVMAAGDQATGLDVLSRLYAEMGAAPVQTDLDALFSKLGVSESDGRVVFDDSAPLAAFRRHLTAQARGS